MRIISGELKGRSIKFLKNEITRPLKDSVKENIFNIMNHSKNIHTDIINAEVLDLYSGFGSFGLECISRGSKKVTFFENNKNVANVIKENLVRLSIIKKADIFNEDVEKFDSVLEKKKFNIFFFDPPYKDKKFISNLSKFKKRKIFTPAHSVIIHREVDSQDKLEEYLNIKLIKEYGRSKITFGTFS